MYLYDNSTNLFHDAIGMLHALGQNLSQDNMPTNPLPPGRTPPVPMPTNPVVPKKWCPELNKIKSNACFSYSHQEIAISRTAAGHLAPDVILIQPPPPNTTTMTACGYLIIRDFGVNWRHVKQATKNEQLLRDWLHRFETDPSLVLRIVGYSDCAGAERNNFLLRRGRARNIFKLLGLRARSRVMAVVAAPSQTYLTENSTAEARAHNRAVVIEFFINDTQVT